ncbi:YeeE/YedE family protein [Chromatocurvus halotolerans]|uniref:Uncharacterized protein n=1 Tax=Chromatocurvus halotolerans TaxID=1132028 RepID=A0A4R2KR13_9GAMM|nr:YeeE/YedE family protein [Chromatocurvus halotolerans]TCO75147.1 hypothetical protein EV688_110102 [Chromatocurvus halotolerans]
MTAANRPPIRAIRSALTLFSLAVIGFTFAMAGPRAALLMLIGLGFGLVLEGLRFGFTGPWRRMIQARDGRGLLAQFVAIGLCALVAFPLLAAFPDELYGAHAPVGIAMLAAAFVFGATMQIVLGCGSGVLVNAGSGNLMAVLALLGFVVGSFFGTLHLDWWTGLGSLPVHTLQGSFGESAGLWVTLTGLAALAILVARLSRPGQRLPSPRLWLAAILVAALAVLNLVVAGQSWGIVYGLGLWGAKAGQAAGMDVLATAFWSAPDHAERLQQSLLTDVTSLTNIGIIIGAFVAMRWRRDPGPQVPRGSTPGRLGIALSGLILGYSARIAFGCNVGAYFSGIATGSFHGWAWFAAAFAGSALALHARPRVLQWLSLSAAATPGGSIRP